MPKWWNGRHACLRRMWRELYGFKSRLRQIYQSFNQLNLLLKKYSGIIVSKSIQCLQHRRKKTISKDNFSGGSSQNAIINERIRSNEVRLIDDEGTNHGVVPTSQALQMAYDKDLDLVLISPNQVPPVAKILNYGKYKFEAEKRAKEAKKKQHTVDVKEIKMRYNIDVHDYEVRMKNIKKFIAAGNKVKILIMLRGREVQHSQLAFNLAVRVQEDIAQENCIIEKKPSLEGKNVIMILAPSNV